MITDNVEVPSVPLDDRMSTFFSLCCATSGNHMGFGLSDAGPFINHERK
jgi:hypothetical protein